MNYTIRPATRKELDIAVGWAANEGWNPGKYDADAFYATDSKGFLMGFIGSEPIASISAVKYDDLFGFIGFYIVKPQYRGKGYGFRIWKEAMKYLDGYIIGLDGVLNQKATYKLSGFSMAYRNIRYEGKGSDSIASDTNVVPVSQIPFETLLSYDDKIFPVTRATFLKSWITQPESIVVGYMDNTILRGYGMVRKCGTGFKVGPLFADSSIVATALFEKLQSFVGMKNTIFLDVPEIHSAGIELAKRYGMTPMFETARMYREDPPSVPIDKIFGVTTFELG